MSKLTEYWLSVDLSAANGTLALHCLPGLGQNPQLIDSHLISDQGNHSENFVPTLKKCLSRCAIRLNDIHRFITTSGPGSFTGLRIAMASIKALAYVNERPMEILSGSEIRMLEWVSQNPNAAFDAMFVLTNLTSDRFVCAHFSLDTNQSQPFPTLISEQVMTDFSFTNPNKRNLLLLDQKINPISIPEKLQASCFQFSLEAKYLAPHLLKAKNRQTITQTADWVQLSPNYFGSTRF